MRERADAIGGLLKIHSSLGEGVHITLSIPADALAPRDQSAVPYAGISEGI
jgi:hypothetical protein